MTMPTLPADSGMRRVQSGFTLIEILVAFAVAALLLGALYQTFATGLRSGVAAENLSGAVLLAQSALDAAAGTPPSAGVTDDRIDGYERRTSVRPRPDLAAEGQPASLFPYEIEVTVTWRDGRRERKVSLATLALGTAPEPAR